MTNTLKKISSGKVREIYEVDDDKLLILTTDRISAFDVIFPTLITNKGKILNKLSEFWFKLTENVIKNHMISIDAKDFPIPKDELDNFKDRSMLVEKLKIVPIECVVRGYITGSGWDSYKSTGTVCGIELPKGLQESEQLSEPIFTPSTKATEGHDIYIDFEKLVETVGLELANLLKAKSIEIYTTCAKYAKGKGIIIADTKFEFGLNSNGELVLADEVLTPDSSRFWSRGDYQIGRGQKSYDKQYLRDWLISNNLNGVEPTPELPDEVVKGTFEKYVQAYTLITGETITF